MLAEFRCLPADTTWSAPKLDWQAYGFVSADPLLLEVNDHLIFNELGVVKNVVHGVHRRTRNIGRIKRAG